MIWVFGNSHERILIKDLNDAIYFHQKKQYTDQEFEGSRDLQREIQAGRIIKIDQKPEIKGSFPDKLGTAQVGQAQTLDLREMRRVITEVLSENKTDGVDIKDLVTSLIPIIAETVRGEISKIPAGQAVVQDTDTRARTKFEDPSYIPEVNTDGMKSNINIEGTSVDGSSMTTSLELLKKMNI